MGAILTVKDLNVTYINKTRRVMAVRRASFSIDKGDSLGIVGESGSGKSTLAMALLRLHPKSTEITGEALFEIQERAMELLKLVNLPPRVYRLYPHEMSGGMLQRVAIAISLLHHPQLLIFDEATTALDVVTQGQILREILELEQTLATRRIMITHDMSVVAAT